MNITNVTSYTDVLIGANTISGGYLINVFVLTVFIIGVLTNVKKHGRSKSIVFSSVITLLISIFLNMANLISEWVITTLLIILAGGLVMFLINKEKMV